MTPHVDPPRVVSLFTAKGSRLPMRPHDSVVVETGRGIVGDRYHGAKHRHVTVQSAASLAEASEVFGSAIDAGLTRRNVTLSHGAVPTTPGTRLRLGEALLEVVRVAAPCRMLDMEIGDGAQAALRRRAGTCFRVLEGGTISVGDPAILEPG